MAWKGYLQRWNCSTWAKRAILPWRGLNIDCHIFHCVMTSYWRVRIQSSPPQSVHVDREIEKSRDGAIAQSVWNSPLKAPETIAFLNGTRRMWPNIAFPTYVETCCAKGQSGLRIQSDKVTQNHVKLEIKSDDPSIGAVSNQKCPGRTWLE